MSQRVFIKNKYESTKSPAEVIRLFGIEYPDRPPLSTATIWKINEKFTFILGDGLRPFIFLILNFLEARSVAEKKRST